MSKKKLNCPECQETLSEVQSKELGVEVGKELKRALDSLLPETKGEFELWRCDKHGTWFRRVK